MTEKEYMDKLKEMILLYKQIREMSKEISDGGFAYLINANVSPYGKEEFHLSGNRGERLPGLKFALNDEMAPDNWDVHSTEFAGVKLFYLTHKDDRENNDADEGMIRLTD